MDQIPSMTSHTAANVADAVHAATTAALWATEWQLHGNPDVVLDALASTSVSAGVRAGSAAAADLSDLPGPGDPTAPMVDLLALLRHAGPPALVLPVPGDLRGLPPGGEIVGPAMEAGAVLVLPSRRLALVPWQGHWRAYEGAMTHPALSAADATQLLDAAVHGARREIENAGLGTRSGEPHDLVRREMVARRIDPPPSTPAVARTLLARATTLAALITVARQHGPTTVTGFHRALVDDALAPLGAAAGEARRTAVAMTAAALVPDGTAATEQSPRPRTPTRRIRRRP